MDRRLRRALGVLLPALAVLFLVAATDLTLTRGPYLQSVTARSAIVAWRTDVPGNSQIDFGVGGYTRSISDTTSMTEHVITLTDLMTGTEVMYRVVTNGAELASGSFHTASAAEQPFTFAVIGDSGIASTAQYSVAGRLVALDPQFVLHTGDVVYPNGAASDYDAKFFQPYQTLLRRAPLFPVLGNHDVMSANGQPYLDAFHLPHNNPADTERYYSFDWGNAHFTALDFNDGPSAEQLAWLKNDLATNGQEWKFVFYHQAIYSSGPHGYESWVDAKRALLAPIFAANKVDIVFNGHDHDYERTKPISDVVYIVSGGGGANLYPVVPQPFSTYAKSAYHTVAVKIDGCTLTLQAIQPDGTVIDSTTLTHRCTAPAPQVWIYLPIIWKNWSD